MSWWERQYGKTPRGQIAMLLRGGPKRVEELATELGVTDNAVRAHLSTLEREGIVRASGVRRDGGVGKPATLYAIAPDALELFSRAYSPMLVALLAELRQQTGLPALRRLLRKVGRRMAPRRATGSLESRVRAGAALLTDLGGAASVSRDEANYIIAGRGCPLASAVRSCPETCRAVEQLLAEVTQARVTERCDRSGPPNCQFVVTAPE
ncbi:MAG: helix-turn-helix transcriptional regulator [Gemmatimonadales bacterium]